MMGCNLFGWKEKSGISECSARRSFRIFPIPDHHSAISNAVAEGCTWWIDIPNRWLEWSSHESCRTVPLASPQIQWAHSSYGIPSWRRAAPSQTSLPLDNGDSNWWRIHSHDPKISRIHWNGECWEIERERGGKEKHQLVIASCH